jgi:hypothetical protein
MTTPSDKNGNEPADLSELTATDALLDRLAARAAHEEDLQDPAAALLSDLLAEIDESRVPDVGAARLLEVLAGRPLYIAAAEEDVDAARHVIDLTGDGAAEPAPAAATADAADPQAPVAESGAAELVPPARRPGVTPLPERTGARRWDRALANASLPAAAVLLLAAVGGGVSAAVTGDPMTPVNGISRVVEQLPGVKDSGHDVARVRGEITAADRAVRKRDASAASLHLEAARRGLGGLPEADQDHLGLMIESLQTRLGTDDETPDGSSDSTPPLSGVIPTTAPPEVDPTDPPEKPAVTAEPTGVPATEDPGPEQTAEPTTPVEESSTVDEAPPELPDPTSTEP